MELIPHMLNLVVSGVASDYIEPRNCINQEKSDGGNMMNSARSTCVTNPIQSLRSAAAVGVREDF